jgi:hypothetical protein
MDIVGVPPAKTFDHEGTKESGWAFAGVTLMTLERLLECQPRRSHFQS